MVNGFKAETHELTEYELEILLPKLLKGLNTKIGEKNAITSTKAIQQLKNLGLKITPPRWRKLIAFIRTNNLIYNLISTSKGYYIATKQEEVRKYIESLDQRANAIITVRDSLNYQLQKSINLTINSKSNE